MRQQLLIEGDSCRFEDDIVLIQTFEIFISDDRTDKTGSLEVLIDVKDGDTLELCILVHQKIERRLPFESKAQDSDILIFQISDIHTDE